MTISRAAGTRILALALLAAAATLGIAGCGSIDEALFAGGTEEAAQAPANAPANAQAAAPEAAQPETPAPEAAEAGAPVAAPAPAVATQTAPPPRAIASETTPLVVEPGSDTGTSVSHTIANLRSQLQALEAKFATDGQHFAELETTAAQATATFQQTTATISTRLEVGTTRGNPELIAQWNTAQGALDAITSNINALSALAKDVSGDSATAHGEQNTIQTMFDVSGQVDEDHRQLVVLSNETGETLVIIDRRVADVTQAIRRETAYVANERGNLTTLALAIKAGEYSPLLARPSASAANTSNVAAASTRSAAAASAGPAASNSPIVTIKFARSHTTYERELYSALSQALAAKPSASFDVIGISPTGGSAKSMQVAQNSAQRHAQDVMHSMGEMGVPATRMAVSSSTDPSVTASEVRVYIR